MAIPVIDPITSVLGYNQYEEWEYQPFATGTPTSWSSTPLPPGLTLDTTTGKISGAATVPGVFIVQLTATNGDGPSVYTPTSMPPVTGGHLTIGIEAQAYAPNSAINIVWDMQTGEISILGSTATAEKSDGTLAALLSAKEDDDLLFFVRCINQGTYLDLPLTSLKFAIKEFEPESVLVASTAGFFKVGTGPRTYYILHAHLDRDTLASKLSGYEDDDDTFFKALAEFELIQDNLGYPDSTAGPASLRSTSRNFRLNLERDLIQD